MTKNTKATSCQHRYNSERFKQGDAFNSHCEEKQIITPVTPEERARANDAREQLVRDTRATLNAEG